MNLVIRTLSILKPALQDTKVRKLLLINVGIVLLAVAGIFGITHWRDYFISSIQAKEAAKFVYLLFAFAGIAGIVVIARGFQAYIAKLIEFRSREVLYDNYVEKLITGEISNQTVALEQRLTADTILIPRIAGGIFFGGLEAIVNIAVFGAMTAIAGPWYTIPVLFAYVVFGMLFAKRIGAPLVQMDYEQQSREARLYRAIIDWLPSRSAVTAPKMDEVKLNWLQLATRSKLLGFFTSSHGQLANVLPMALLASVYFTGTITMGKLFSLADAAGRLVDSLAFLIDRRSDINELNACCKRLEELT